MSDCLAEMPLLFEAAQNEAVRATTPSELIVCRHCLNLYRFVGYNQAPTSEEPHRSYTEAIRLLSQNVDKVFEENRVLAKGYSLLKERVAKLEAQLKPKEEEADENKA